MSTTSEANAFSAVSQEESLQSQLLGEMAPEIIAPPKAQTDTLNDFEMRVHRAKISGDEWVETSDEIINYYNKSGMGKSQTGKDNLYFLYKGVKVCVFGMADKAEAQMSEQGGRIVHGPTEGILI